MAKKEYVKPVLTKNEPLVDITFASGVLSGTAGTPGTLISKAINPQGIDVGSPDYGGGTITGGGGPGTGMDGFGTGGTEMGTITGSGTIVGTGTIIPGTGGAPGTIL